MTISETKEAVRKQIDDLIATGVVKNDAQIASEIGISKSAISSMLSLKSNKKVSQRFILELEKRYFSTKEVKDYASQVNELVVTQRILLDTCAQLLAQSTSKMFAVVRAELLNAVKMSLQN